MGVCNITVLYFSESTLIYRNLIISSLQLFCCTYLYLNFICLIKYCQVIYAYNELKYGIMRLQW